MRHGRAADQGDPTTPAALQANKEQSMALSRRRATRRPVEVPGMLAQVLGEAEGERPDISRMSAGIHGRRRNAVSYTHLTLPTICSV